jgi:hypothetical protein
MIDEQVSKKVGQEIKNKTWGVTEQFLQVHDVVLVDGQPKIQRIDNEKADGTTIAYLPVKDQSFFLAIYLDSKADFEIKGVGTESYNSVYFQVTSDKFNLDELSSMTTLRPTKNWNKGDKRKIGDTVHKFSSIIFEPNPEPDEFEDKIKKLLNFLEQDKSGVKRLTDNADGFVQVAIKFHNGNTMLGGPSLDKETIKRLSDLNLSVDFDLYADGNFFKEE